MMLCLQETYNGSAACGLLLQEQLGYIIAGTCCTVMDLHEMGGELTSLRRKEANVLKQQDSKEAAVKVVANAESRWKGRLLTLFESLG